ncbi:MAG: hypothetical protein ACKODH_06135 [Limisphaerales bacterium]
MSLQSSRTRLTALTKQLAVRWQETREQWQDARADDFQKRHLDELFARVNAAAHSLEELDRVLAKLRHDCE